MALDLRIAVLQFNCNVADIFITAGAVVLFVYLLFVDGDAILRKKDKSSDSVKSEKLEEEKTQNCDNSNENTILKNNAETDKNEDSL